jgi:hypothetical protein
LKVFARLLTLLCLIPSLSWGTKYNGRFTLGGYTSLERFDSVATGSDKNDFQTIPTRFFIKGEDINHTSWEASLDLRDKHDFFDKLNKESLSLSDRNELQLRQLSTQNSRANQLITTQLGRFPVKEVSSTFVDGVQIEEHWTKSWTSSLFGGLNPRKDGQSYLDFESKSNVSGLTLTYNQRSQDWNKNFYVTHALTTLSYDGHVDRNFLFQNLIYQWQEYSRVMTLIYYDFVPRAYLQNGFLSWQQQWTTTIATELNNTTIDVIEYSRRQSVLEQLPSSPFQESEVKFIYKLNKLQDRYYLRFSSGERAVDGLKSQSSELAFIKSQIFGPKWDLYTVLESKNNFTSQDGYFRLGLGYFSRKWELNLDTSYGVQNNVNGTTNHPTLVDATLAYYLSRNTYVAFSGQSASNEDVKIMSGFFRLSYRFGNEEIPAVRDGAPPRGPL